MGLEEGGGGQREALGGRGEDLILEGDEWLEMLLFQNRLVEVRITDPFDSGIDECPAGLAAVNVAEISA